jgi:hypothetical protein
VVDVAGLRDVVEGRLGHTEVLGEDVLGRVREPVSDQEGFVLGEVPVIEHQEEFAVL